MEESKTGRKKETNEHTLDERKTYVKITGKMNRERDPSLHE